MADTVGEETQALKKTFKPFHDRRELWDKVFERNNPTTLPPELTGSQEGLDYQTPDVAKTVFDHVDVLVMNPPLFDIATLDSADSAKKTGREIMLWTARGWEYENEGRWWDRAVYEGAVRHGVKVMALRWKGGGDLELSDDEDEAVDEIVESAGKKEVRRKRHPFYWVDCDVFGCMWLGDERDADGPDVFYYKYELPYISCKEMFKPQEGKEFRLDGRGKRAWVGEGESKSEWDGDKAYVTVRDSTKPDGSRCPLEGCEHSQRVIKVYVSGDKNKLEDSDLVEEIDSPFPGCSYFIIGGRVSSSRNPDQRYHPLIEPLYVEASWQNYLNTLLATAIRQDYADEDLYIDISKVPQWVQLPEGGEMSAVEKPEPGSGEIPMYPGPVLRYPKSISPHLVTLLEESQKRMAEFKMNRFLQGTAYTEASNATAAAFKSQYQQAALPFNGLHSHADMARIRSRQFEYHAIRYWAQADTEDVSTRYYAVMTGSQGTVRTTQSSKPGETVWVDAKKIESVDFDLRILTESETLAEQEQRWFLAKDQYVSGVGTPEDLVRAAGYDDVEGQLEKLRGSYIQEDMEPLFREAARQMHIKKASLATGFDFGALIGQPVFPPGPGTMAPMVEAPGQGGVETAGRNSVTNGNNALNTPGENGMTPGGPPV